MTKNAEFFAPYCLVLITYPKCFRQFSNAERLVTLFKVRVRSNLVALTCERESEIHEYNFHTLTLSEAKQQTHCRVLCCFFVFFMAASGWKRIQVGKIFNAL